VTLSWD